MFIVFLLVLIGDLSRFLRRGSLPVPSVHFPVAVFLHSYEERINISIWATAHLPLP